MQIILAEDMEKLGRAGDVVKVADGYARNYLLPRKLALLASAKNMRWVEHQKSVILEKARRNRASAEAFGERIAALEVTIEKKAGDEGKLFGSVTAHDIADAIAAKGIEVDRRRIVIGEPIKRLGDHTVTVKVHMDVAPEITVHVVPEGGEAAPAAEPAKPVEAAAEAATADSGTE